MDFDAAFPEALQLAMPGLYLNFVEDETKSEMVEFPEGVGALVRRALLGTYALAGTNLLPSGDGEFEFADAVGDCMEPGSWPEGVCVAYPGVTNGNVWWDVLGAGTGPEGYARRGRGALRVHADADEVCAPGEAEAWAEDGSGCVCSDGVTEEPEDDSPCVSLCAGGEQPSWVEGACWCVHDAGVRCTFDGDAAPLVAGALEVLTYSLPVAAGDVYVASVAAFFSLADDDDGGDPIPANVRPALSLAWKDAAGDLIRFSAADWGLQETAGSWFRLSVADTAPLNATEVAISWRWSRSTSTPRIRARPGSSSATARRWGRPDGPPPSRGARTPQGSGGREAAPGGAGAESLG